MSEKKNLFSRLSFDPSTIKGPYSIFGAWLLVLDGPFVLWFILAETSEERTVAGSLFLLVLIIFIIVFIWWELNRGKMQGKIKPKGMDDYISPAKNEISKDELNNIGEGDLVGPDRSYVISRPPKEWICEEMTFRDWLIHSLGLQDHGGRVENILGQANNASDEKITNIRYAKESIVVPIPGKTLAGGMKVITAFAPIIKYQLAISPIARRQSPFFIKRSLEDSILRLVIAFLGSGAVTIESIREARSPHGKKMTIVETIQRLEHVILDGQEIKSVSLHNTYIGISGYEKDYLIYMCYPSFSAEGESDAYGGQKVLQDLVNSFRPLGVTDVEAMERDSRIRAERNQMEFLRKNAPQVFGVEFSVFLMRLRDMDMDDPDHRHIAIKQCEAFQLLAKEICYQHAGLNLFWSLLDKAKTGDAGEFKDAIIGLLKGLDEVNRNENK